MFKIKTKSNENYDQQSVTNYNVSITKDKNEIFITITSKKFSQSELF